MWPGSKKNLVSTLTRPERLALVERCNPGLALTEQADLLTVSRRSIYYQPVPPSVEEVQIKHAIDRIYTEQPSYGSRRIGVILARDMDWSFIGKRSGGTCVKWALRASVLALI